MERNADEIAINRLTRALPWEERNSLRSEYKNKSSDVTYVLDRTPAALEEVGTVDSIRVLLAIALFYRRVIKPIEGAHDFAAFAMRFDHIDSIQIGRDEIGTDDVTSLGNIVAWFIGFFFRTNLNPDVFDFVDAGEFVSKLRRHARRVRIAEQ